MDSLSDIASFVEVVRSGSFTAAATRLGLSKSLVSKQVSRLEDRLGARLLQRSTRRLSLTEVGELFFRHALQGLDELAEAEAAVSRLQQAPRGRLRLNVPMSFGILHLAPALAEFQQRYPELHVDMRLDDRQLDLVEDGFDLAIRIAVLADSSLVARRLAACRLVLCATPTYLQRCGQPQTPEDLRQHNCLVYGQADLPITWHFARDGRSYDVPISGSLRTNNSLALRDVLLAGAGITLTPSFVVGPDLRAGRLQEVLPEYPARELNIYAVYPERRHLSPKVRAFIEFIAERISDPPYWDH